MSLCDYRGLFATGKELPGIRRQAMSGIIFVLFLVFYILGLALLADKEFDSGFAVLLVFAILAIIFLVMFSSQAQNLQNAGD